jgi:hypothetical protein
MGGFFGASIKAGGEGAGGAVLKTAEHVTLCLTTTDLLMEDREEKQML